MPTQNAKALRATANEILNTGEREFRDFDQKKVNAALTDDKLMRRPTFAGLLRLIASTVQMQG